MRMTNVNQRGVAALGITEPHLFSTSAGAAQAGWKDRPTCERLTLLQMVNTTWHEREKALGQHGLPETGMGQALGFVSAKPNEISVASTLVCGVSR
mmetsp:Transcript_16607/g.22346  ORF Transcript_16607/g.22346 Transcript_16607/m.22346 type:complete len:96 (+) Transcript_16607:340-627(+)